MVKTLNTYSQLFNNAKAKRESSMKTMKRTQKIFLIILSMLVKKKRNKWKEEITPFSGKSFAGWVPCRHSETTLAQVFGVIVLLIVSSVCANNFAAGAEFHAVGRADEGWNIQFSGFGMSADGQVIVSGARTPDPGLVEAYRWSPDSGRTMLGFFNPTNDSEPESFAYAASADGSVIVGSSLVNTYHVINFPVDEVTGFSLEGGSFTSLPWLSGDDQAYPLDVTADGSIAVGGSWEMDLGLFWVTPWIEAVKWNTSTGLKQGLGTLGSDDDSYAIAVSDDGGYIVGQSGDIDDWWRPFVWHNGDWNALEYLGSGHCPSSYDRSLSPYCEYGASCCNEVYGISSDGLYAVGRLSDGTNTVPVYWHTTQLSPNLLTLIGNDEDGAAFDLSYTAGVIGGTSGGKAVLWKEDNNYDPILVEHLLSTLRLGNQIADWRLTEVRQVSDDGKLIAGYGIHPNGEKWIWHADLRDPPLNDACENARFIGQSPFNPTNVNRLSVTGTTLEATPDINVSCADPDARRVWYSYSAEVEGYLQLDLCGTIMPNTAITVHEGCPVTIDNQVACSNSSCGDHCDDDPCILPPRIKIMPGTTYSIGISSPAEYDGGQFILNYQFFPVNDACDEAYFLPPTPSRTWGITLGMTPDTAPVCQGITVTDAPGVWYKVIGTGSIMTASLCGNAVYDTKLSVYCGGCGVMTCVAASDDACGKQSSVSWCSIAGAVYHILVHGYDYYQSGIFWLDVTEDGAPCIFSVNCSPDNDECDNAIPIAKGWPFLSDNTGANTSGILPSCQISNKDMWFDYTTQCDGDVYIDTCLPIGSLEDTVVSVYSGCSGNELECNDDYVDETVDCGYRSAVILPLPPNTNLKIQVAGAGSSIGTFPLRVDEVPHPVTVTQAPLPDAFQGQPYSEWLSFSGGCPKIWNDLNMFYFVNQETKNNLPAGLQLDGLGHLYGIPEYSGEYTFNVAVADWVLDTPGDEADFTLRILPSNDDCSDAIPITEGVFLFGTFGTTTDGPDEPDQCSFNGYSNIGQDIWFRYTSTCTGKRATASLCGSAYDTKLAVYDDTCPTEASAIACNDDSPACDTPQSYQSYLTFDVMPQRQYLIRIGGFAGVWGSGKLSITCYNDCNDNGVIDRLDISDGNSKDCNRNMVPDECECDIAGFALGYGRTRCEIDCCFGDADGDGDVDGLDLAQMIDVNCF